jgi:hypothetical protein
MEAKSFSDHFESLVACKTSTQYWRKVIRRMMYSTPLFSTHEMGIRFFIGFLT